MRIHTPAFSMLFIAVAFTTPFASVNAANAQAIGTNSNLESTTSLSRSALAFCPAVHVTVTNAPCIDSGSISLAQRVGGECSYALVDSTSKVTIANGVLTGGQIITMPVAAGTYMVNLQDENGSIIKPVYVTGATVPLPVADFQVTAGFSLAGITQAETGERIYTTASVGNRASYVWTFGNGMVDSNTHGSTVYRTAGQYLITLAVKNTAGCITTMEQPITITDAPAPTAIKNVDGNGNVTIWSDNNVIYTGFANTTDINATINIYDLLGKQVSSTHSTQSLYKQQIDNINAGYYIVSVESDKKVTTKKVFIANLK